MMCDDFLIYDVRCPAEGSVGPSVVHYTSCVVCRMFASWESNCQNTICTPFKSV